MPIASAAPSDRQALPPEQARAVARVLLDGFDLGVGILYGFEPDLQSRNLVMNSIAPIWDGNETWLIMGGIGLFAAFPLAFAIIIPAVYFPVLLMLLALVFRGVAFEFQFKEPRVRRFWQWGSASAPRWPPSPRGACSAPSSRASGWTGATSPAARSTG